MEYQRRKTLRSVLIGTVLLLAMASYSTSEANWSVYLRHTGPLEVGMSLSDVRNVLSDPKAHLFWLELDDPKGVNGCSYLESMALPSKVSVMFNRQRIVRIDINGGSPFKTSSGIGIGDTEERVKAVYGSRIRVEPHPYTDDHYLIYTPAEKS